MRGRESDRSPAVQQSLLETLIVEPFSAKVNVDGGHDRSLVAELVSARTG